MTIKLKILFLFTFVFLYTIASFAEEMPQQFEGFNLQGYKDNGEKAWDVKGDKADVEGQKIKLSNVNANSYGEESVNVTAEIGYVDQASGNMRLENDVIITNEDGSQLLTDSLNWNRNDDLVTTDDNVFINNDGMTVTGTGMQAKPGFKSAQINQDVSARVDTDKIGNKKEEVEISEDTTVNKIVTITCDGPMVIDQGKSMAEFNENVVAVRGEQILKADKLEIYTNAETNEIEKMIGIGNVEVEQGENKSFAQKMIYDAQEQKLQLFGRPKIQMIVEGDDGLKSFGN